jgi:hypothetical protein
MGSVTTNSNGEFEFPRRPPGRYLLGVSLYNAPNPTGPSYPRTYFPGTTNRTCGVAVVIEPGGSNSVYDFSMPFVLAKSELEAIVESEVPGRLTFCLAPLDSIVRRSSRYDVGAAVPLHVPVVDGQRYEVHAHLA